MTTDDKGPVQSSGDNVEGDKVNLNVGNDAKNVIGGKYNRIVEVVHHAPVTYNTGLSYSDVREITAEIVYNLIPKQRLDRIDEFLAILDEKMSGIKQEVLEQKMQSAEFIDLFEDGMWQVARALSKERKEYIASLLKNSIQYEDLNHIEQKKLLSLLNELNDAQIIILKSKEFLYQSQAQEAFYNLHREVLQPPSVTMQSSEEEVDEFALYKAFVNDLQRLELIETTFKKPKKNEFPEFDMKTGMVKAQSSKITRLGRLLLRYIDMEEKGNP